jgi:hypothetical protein
MMNLCYELCGQAHRLALELCLISFLGSLDKGSGIKKLQDKAPEKEYQVIQNPSNPEVAS